VVRRDVPGFVWNRLQFALVREALHLIQEGVVTAPEIDQVTAGLGVRWAVSGPVQILDLAGLQTALAVGRNLYPALSQAQEPPPLVQELVTQGHLGVRTLRGFYTYQEGEPEQIMAGRDAKLRRLFQTLGEGGSP
jgi:3-hydroxybutyryl-CoA dehydrogenase